VTFDLSTPAVADLRRSVATWWQAQVTVNSLAEAEEAALALSRLLAQAMLEAGVAALGQQATYAGPRQPCACGGRARFVGYRKRWIQTRCGAVRVARAYYHCGACATGQLPWDRAQGLNERLWSPAVKALAVELGARLSYREASLLLSRLLGYSLEESSLQELEQEVGERLRAEDAAQTEALFSGEATRVSQEQPERLYIGIDAARAHTHGGWHDIKVGAVYTARQGADGLDVARQQRYEAAEEGCEAFGQRLYRRAVAAGVEAARQVVVLGDGADWIWNQAQLHFSGCIEILDYYHACDHIWRLAHALYGEGSPQGQRWARAHCRTLKERGPTPLLRALKRRVAASGAAREALRLERAYFTAHRRRMRYPAFRKAGLMIGSGPVEAACKVVVAQRLKGAGMRWTAGGADAVLAVRTAVLSDELARIGRLARAA
jgi:hypothetical protein